MAWLRKTMWSLPRKLQNCRLHWVIEVRTPEDKKNHIRSLISNQGKKRGLERHPDGKLNSKGLMSSSSLELILEWSGPFNQETSKGSGMTRRPENRWSSRDPIHKRRLKRGWESWVREVGEKECFDGVDEPIHRYSRSVLFLCNEENE